MARQLSSLPSSRSSYSGEPVASFAGVVGGALSKHVIEQTPPAHRPGVALQHFGTVGVITLAALLLGEERFATEFTRGYLSAWQPTT